jgi:hypothetical protein
MTRAQGSFEVLSMHEDAYEEREGGGKLTRAWGDQAFSGDIDGHGAVQWLMTYPGNGTAHYVGLQRIAGSVGGRTGSFIIEAAGDFDGKTSAGKWSVVAGSGTGGLQGISGDGTFRAGPGPKGSYELDYAFDRVPSGAR